MNEFDHDFDERPVSASWVESVTSDLQRSSRRAWIIAIIAAIIALIEAVALVFLIPLKTVEPYTILVDRQTGNVETLAPLNGQQVTPDDALTRSMLVQYVTARESFSIDSVQDDFRKVSLWSDNATQQLYAEAMGAENPQSPLVSLPERALLKTEIKSVSNLADDRAMVRFTTTRRDPGAASQSSQHWVSVISYRFSSAEMSEEDRYVNPLGFQVTRYRRDAETLPEKGIVNGVQAPVLDTPIEILDPIEPEPSEEPEEQSE
ncbi:MAG: VirB8/TrbF family protein [Erythrobacter sp.]